MAAYGYTRTCFQCNERKNDFYNDSILCMDCFEGYPLCLECGLNERNKPHPWCADCYQEFRHEQPAAVIPMEEYVPPTLFTRVTDGSNSFREVLKLFVDRWDRRKSQCPEIIAAYTITNEPVRLRYKQYKDQLLASGKDPNEKVYFHGTVLACDLLSSGLECSNLKCGVCGISQEGFDENRIGHNIPRFQRFGRGLYLAPNSSKCHDYTQGSYNVRAMLVCKVALGRAYMLTQTQTNLAGPPHGFDSVYGQNSPNGALNYDEVVVYCSQAVLPTHVIVYNRDGVGKIAM